VGYLSDMAFFNRALGIGLDDDRKENKDEHHNNDNEDDLFDNDEAPAPPDASFAILEIQPAELTGEEALELAIA
jgi:hypothetical protein